MQTPEAHCPGSLAFLGEFQARERTCLKQTNRRVLAPGELHSKLSSRKLYRQMYPFIHIHLCPTYAMHIHEYAQITCNNHTKGKTLTAIHYCLLNHVKQKTKVIVGKKLGSEVRAKLLARVN